MIDRIREIERHMIRLGVSAKVVTNLLDIIRTHATADPAFEPDITSEAMETEIGQIARIFHKSSLRRSEVLGQPVSDPAWNMLLALVADATEYRTSCVTSLCYASGAPMTTALRHLSKLETDGKIQRREHRHDSRKSIIEATPATLAKMKQLILSFCVAPPLR
jgi:DNA-binding MarR family transcriptional regulator